MIDYLKKIIEEYKIGIIKMEVVRNIEPKDRFLMMSDKGQKRDCFNF